MRKTLTLAVVLAAAGCAAPADRPTSSPAVAAPGSPRVVVVLRDLTPPSRRVRFETAAAFALRDDGARVPLAVTDQDREGDTPTAERLWLVGAVPAGSYTGIEVAFRAATSADSATPAPMEVPANPLRLDAPFLVSADEGVVLAADLRSSLESGTASRFLPAIDLRPRSKPAPGRYGLASIGSWDALALFDKRTGALASVLPVGADPMGLAVDAERLQAYVAVAGDDQVAVVDLPEGRVRERVFLRTGDAPRDVGLTPDGRTLLVANAGSDTVSFVDTGSATEIERVAVQGRPVSLLLDRGGGRAFVLAERSSVITVLGVTGRGVVGTIPVEPGPVRARFSGRNDERILVAHADSPYLSIIDAATLSVTRRVYVGAGARALAVDPRSGRIFLARRKTGRIEVFDPTSFLPTEEIPVPGEVAWLTVDSEGNGLGVLLRDPAEARIVGIVGGEVVLRTPLGANPAALGFVQGGSRP